MDLRLDVRNFITGNFLVADPVGLADDASLMEAGVVDSTGVLEIIAFLEFTFGLTVEDDEIVPENLDSIDRIVAYVLRKRATGPSGRALAPADPGTPPAERPPGESSV